MDYGTNLDAYLLIFTFVLGAASAFFYIQSLGNSEWHKYRKVYNEHQKIQAQQAADYEKKQANKSNSKKTNDNSDKTASHDSDSNTSMTTDKSGDKNGVRIYVDGCWDLCHSGHYNAIRQAKKLGDHLIVGVHSCDEIARNKRSPVMNDKERLACIESCKWVDQVVFDVPYSPSIALIDRSDINADYVAHGDDIAINANGQSAYAEVENRLKIFKRTPGVSTTNLIDRLVSALNYETAISNNKEDNKYCNNKAQQTNKSESKLTQETNSSGSGNDNDNDKDSDSDSDNSNSNSVESKEKMVRAVRDHVGSWSQFLSSSHRIAAFSNSKTPRSTDKVVYIDGIFDLFHAGHIAAIKEAKKQGTFLYVGLFDDAIVQSKKGPYFPLMNIQERTLNVLSCKFVDEVIIGCPWELGADMIKVLNIETVVSSTVTNELCDSNHKRYDFVKEKGMFQEIIPKDSQLTTKNLMMRIANDQKRIEKENENRVKKEMAYLKDRAYVEES